MSVRATSTIPVVVTARFSSNAPTASTASPVREGGYDSDHRPRGQAECGRPVLRIVVVQDAETLHGTQRDKMSAAGVAKDPSLFISGDYGVEMIILATAKQRRIIK